LSEEAKMSAPTGRRDSFCFVMPASAVDWIAHVESAVVLISRDVWMMSMSDKPGVYDS